MVAMDGLLRADREIQRLKRKGLPPIDGREEFEDRRIAGDVADVIVELPGVLNARADRTSGRIAPIEPLGKPLPDRFRPAIEIRVRKIEDGETMVVQLARDSLMFG